MFGRIEVRVRLTRKHLTQNGVDLLDSVNRDRNLAKGLAAATFGLGGLSVVTALGLGELVAGKLDLHPHNFTTLATVVTELPAFFLGGQAAGKAITGLGRKWILKKRITEQLTTPAHVKKDLKIFLKPRAVERLQLKGIDFSQPFKMRVESRISGEPALHFIQRRLERKAGEEERVKGANKEWVEYEGEPAA